MLQQETQAQVFFCEFCKISKEHLFLTEHLRWLLLILANMGLNKILKTKYLGR